jgi:hypothetical protein
MKEVESKRWYKKVDTSLIAEVDRIRSYFGMTRTEALCLCLTEYNDVYVWDNASDNDPWYKLFRWVLRHPRINHHIVTIPLMARVMGKSVKAFLDHALSWYVKGMSVFFKDLESGGLPREVVGDKLMSIYDMGKDDEPMWQYVDGNDRLTYDVVNYKGKLCRILNGGLDVRLED